MGEMNAGWCYSPDHGQICQVIEAQALWGEVTCRIWLPDRDSVVRIPASRLKPLESAAIGSPDNIAYIAAAARVSDALQGPQDESSTLLLAPIGSSVIPLPHQIWALSRASSSDRVRYLLADEVGLGKTIEAGLILRELKIRGQVKRTLVIAPKGLVSQWVSEMRFHFGETFQPLLPEDIKSLKRITPHPDQVNENLGREILPSNPWRMFSQIVVPMDSVKPLDKRRGWSAVQISGHNRERFEGLISAGWDLIIVDEAHRLAGSNDQVARFKLGLGLSEAAPYLLLLTATPHQGKSDSFHRLLSLIDAQEFPNIESVTRERIQPYIIRTEKRHTIDAEGKPLFKPRRTELVPISWEKRHRNQQLLYGAVTEYIREGYNVAIREKRNYIGFLMILMQRLIVSSTSAIRTTLGNRLAALTVPQEQLTLFPPLSEEEWDDLDGQEQIDMLLHARLKALKKNERAEVRLLLEAAARCEQLGPDAKAEALLDWLYRLQSEESDPELKMLLFTEFVPTQEMLHRFLTERGFSAVCLNGSKNIEERRLVQEEFAKGVRILISTDAGGEGLNLQFCHVVINYDIPWNPMRLEQRIGRVDRIGQTRTVRAVNFVLEDSVEHRVREVLEQKLAVIFKELGIDKTGDVLDSAQAGHMFNEMYVKSILNPEKIEESVDNVVLQLQEQAREAHTSASLLGLAGTLEPGEAQRLLTHPMPYWIERMTVSYLKAHGGLAEKRSQGWSLTWPDGKTFENVVFTGKEAAKFPVSRHFTLEEPRIGELSLRLPRFVPGQPIPIVSIPGLPEEVRGVWSLWQITIAAMDWKRGRFMPFSLADDDVVYMPTARHIWDQLLVDSTQVLTFLDNPIDQPALAKLRKTAALYGKPIYEALMQEHRNRIRREQEKADYAFTARRKTINRIGLPQVRNYRLKQLLQEERNFQEQLDQKVQVCPEMVPLLVLQVGVGVHG